MNMNRKDKSIFLSEKAKKKSTKQDETILTNTKGKFPRRCDKETSSNLCMPVLNPQKSTEPQELNAKTKTQTRTEAETHLAIEASTREAERGESCEATTGSAQRRCATAAAEPEVRPDCAASSGTADQDQEQPEIPRKQRMRGPLKCRVNMLLDEESVKMFLSSDQLEKVEALECGPGRPRSPKKQQLLQRQYSEGTKRRHEQIVRQILQDFDLEKCKEKYRNLYAYEKKPQGRSLADFRFRSELIRLMGTEIIRVSDQSWSGRFQHSLREDYERMLVEKEHQLSRLEQDRQHRLHLESIIGDTGAALTRELSKKVKSKVPKVSVANTPIFKHQDHNIRERVIHNRHIEEMYNAKQISQSRMTVTFNPAPTMDVDFLTSGEEEAKTAATKVSPEGSQQVPAGGSGTQLLSADRMQLEVSFSQNIASSSADVFGPKTATMSPSVGFKVLTPEERAERRKKRYRHLPEGVRQLYEEETVAGLYALASRLVYTKPTKIVEEKKAVIID